MLCPVCKGSGALVTFSPRTWWDCPACCGAGAIIMGGPAIIACRGFNIVIKRKK